MYIDVCTYMNIYLRKKIFTYTHSTRTRTRKQTCTYTYDSITFADEVSIKPGFNLSEAFQVVEYDFSGGSGACIWVSRKMWASYGINARFKMNTKINAYTRTTQMYVYNQRYTSWWYTHRQINEHTCTYNRLHSTFAISLRTHDHQTWTQIQTQTIRTHACNTLALMYASATTHIGTVQLRTAHFLRRMAVFHSLPLVWRLHCHSTMLALVLGRCWRRVFRNWTPSTTTCVRCLFACAVMITMPEIQAVWCDSTSYRRHQCVSF